MSGQQWRRVPAEPTTEMLDAWQKTFGTIQDAYRALLAAAPQPPAQEPVAWIYSMSGFRAISWGRKKPDFPAAKNPKPIYQAPPELDAEVDRQQAGARFDLVSHLYRQIEFSDRTFGPGARTQMVLDHIRKELVEVERNPGDVMEWVDVILLALDGAWRSGCSPENVCHAISEKQERNEHRQWPDWRTSDPDKAIEHLRNDAHVAAV